MGNKQTKDLLKRIIGYLPIIAYGGTFFFLVWIFKPKDRAALDGTLSNFFWLGKAVILVLIAFFIIKVLTKINYDLSAKTTKKALNAAQSTGYFVPTLLFIVLFAVLWLTDHKLGWYSFMTRDGATFGAFVVAYIAFAPAFMQDKDKTKKVPIFKKIMVLATIMAVVLAFTDGAKSPFASGANETDADVQYTAPPETRAVPQTQVHKLTATNREFVYQEIPDGAGVESYCPDGTLRDFVYDGKPSDRDDLLDCDVPGRGEDLGNGKTGRRIGFISKSETPTYPTVTVMVN